MAGRRLILPSLLVMLTLGGLAFSGISGVQGFGRAGNFPVPTGAVVPTSMMSVIKKSDPVAPSSATNCSSGIKCAFAAGICLGMAMRFCKGVVAVRGKGGKPDLESEKVPNLDELKDLNIEQAEHVRIPTDGLMSDVTTVTHKGLRVTLENGKTVILHFMPTSDTKQTGEELPSLDQPGEWRVEEDNGNWTSEGDIDVDPGIKFGVLHKELKKEHVYNLATDNCVEKADQLAQKVSQEEREKAFKQTASAAFTAAARSVLQDALNGREVDGNAAMSQSVGAGAGSVTSHAVHGVTGSSPIAGTTGAIVATGVASKLQGASDEQVMEASRQAGMAVAAQEMVRFTVQNVTRCAKRAGLAAEMVTDLPQIADDVMKERYFQAGCRTYLSGIQALMSVAFCSFGPVGLVGSMCFDHYCSKLRDALCR